MIVMGVVQDIPNKIINMLFMDYFLMATITIMLMFLMGKAARVLGVLAMLFWELFQILL